MTLSELLILHAQMGLDVHDEVMLGMIPEDGKGIVPYRITAVKDGFFIINDFSFTEVAKERGL